MNDIYLFILNNLTRLKQNITCYLHRLNPVLPTGEGQKASAALLLQSRGGHSRGKEEPNVWHSWQSSWLCKVAAAALRLKMNQRLLQFGHCNCWCPTHKQQRKQKHFFFFLPSGLQDLKTARYSGGEQQLHQNQNFKIWLICENIYPPKFVWQTNKKKPSYVECWMHMNQKENIPHLL